MTFRLTLLTAAVIPIGFPSAAHAGPVNWPDLCDAVAGQILETDPRAGTAYTYQTKIYRAAGVNPSEDSVEQVRAKVKAWWDAEGSTGTCSSINFSVRDGGILKLAVERNSRNFFNDVVRKWKLDVNRPDRSNGENVLDYVNREMAQNRGRALEPALRYYQTTLIKQGARPSGM